LLKTNYINGNKEFKFKTEFAKVHHGLPMKRYNFDIQTAEQYKTEGKKVQEIINDQNEPVIFTKKSAYDLNTSRAMNNW